MEQPHETASHDIISQRQDIQETTSLSSLQRCRNGCDENKEEKMELDQHTSIADKRSWLRTLLLQTACFLWLVPIVTLLILNCKQYIIGASAWCPNQNCYVGWFNPVKSVPLKNLQDFDKRSHNVLGAIQLVAKALEVWFIVISLALVYLLTFIIAGREDGLPIGYLMRPNEFAELYGLFDPLLWRSLPHLSRSKDTPGSRLYRLRIYLFVGFTVCLCILCNLMGPAAAVLALPTLQWIDTRQVGGRSFGTLNSKDSPIANSSGSLWNSSPYCSDTDFHHLNFSCAAIPLASQLDAWIESSVAAGNYSYAQSQEQYVSFAINQTFSASNSNVLTQDYSSLTWWIPNRQVLSSLSIDYIMMAGMSAGVDAETMKNITVAYQADQFDTYAEYNRSIQANIQRKGPIIGALVQYNMGIDGKTTWTSTIDASRSIRCYNNYTFDAIGSNLNLSTGTYTRCVRMGDGWSVGNKLVAFSMHGIPNNATSNLTPEVAVNVFTSDKVQFFRDGKMPSWLPPACLKAGKVSSSIDCDWNRLFYVQADDDIFNRTQNVTTIELSSRYTAPGHEDTVKLSLDCVTFLNFTSYQLDPSPLTNPTHLVQTQDLPKTGINIMVDPSWILAAWTVDNNGVLDASRAAVVETSKYMDKMVRNPSMLEHMDLTLVLPLFQALSLIDFTADSVDSGRPQQGDNDPTHPLLTRNARLYVWAYGLESRTSKLGLVVVSFGIAVVVAQLVLGFIDRRKYRSPTQLLVAALEHAPSDEFKDVEHSEAKVASLRFHVQGMMTTAGKYSFKKTMGHEAE